MAAAFAELRPLAYPARHPPTNANFAGSRLSQDNREIASLRSQ